MAASDKSSRPLALNSLAACAEGTYSSRGRPTRHRAQVGYNAVWLLDLVIWTNTTRPVRPDKLISRTTGTPWRSCTPKCILHNHPSSSPATPTDGIVSRTAPFECPRGGKILPDLRVPHCLLPTAFNMFTLLTFNDALRDSSEFGSRHLLLGNGFSIDCKPDIFTYRSLFKAAFQNGGSRLHRAFKTVDTTDFERVIRSLEEASGIVSLYASPPGVPEKIRRDAGKLRRKLIDVIAKHHPPTPYDIGNQYFRRCQKFLSYFVGNSQDGYVYTLNYDLLLYWTLMWDRKTPGTIDLVGNDGFGLAENFGSDQLVWIGDTNENKQRIHYLHGALHMLDSGTELIKHQWKESKGGLIDQVKRAIDASQFPLFVAEGTSHQKLKRIQRSPYLKNSLKHFSRRMKKTQDTLLVFGHSFDPSDEHILAKIKNSRLRRLYVSLHGQPDSAKNVRVRSQARSIAEKRIASDSKFLQFYDAESANVWGP